MWQQQQQWKQNRDALTKLEQQKAEGWQIGDDRLEAARRQIARDEANAAAIEQVYVDEQAAVDAQRQQHTERHAQQSQQAQDAYQRMARLQWPGDQASFDAAWPRLLEDWQIRQTAEHTAALAVNVPTIRL